MERLARLGIPPALYEDFVTSGEVARSFLAAAPAELRAAGSLGPLHCLPLGSPAGSALMAGLDIIEARSEEHTSELQTLMRISDAVFCFQKKNNNRYTQVRRAH